MKESRRVDTIETIRILANIRNLPEWFRIYYVSKVFKNDKFDKVSISNEKYELKDLQTALNILVGSNWFDKRVNNVLQEWTVKRNTDLSKNVEHQYLVSYQYGALQRDALIMLITSRNLPSGLQCLNLAFAASQHFRIDSI